MKQIKTFTMTNIVGSSLKFTKYIDSKECFVEETTTEIGKSKSPMLINRKCSGITCGCLDTAIVHGLAKALRDKPIKLVFSRWYEHMDPTTYLSFGNYSILITAETKDNVVNVTFKTFYKNKGKVYTNKYTLENEKKIKSLIEVFS